MVDPRKRRFGPYIRRLADAIALKDWNFAIWDDPPSSGTANACIVILYGRKYATIRLSEYFLDETPQDQRRTILHELIHCHLDTPFMTALDVMPEQTQAGFRRLLEIAVDGLADGFAAHLPLPSFED